MKFIVAAVLLIVCFDGCVGELDINKLPTNIAVTPGATVVFSCAVVNHQNAHSLQWREFTSNPEGTPISDNGNIGAHPNADRYRILQAVAGEYFLQIHNVTMEDGGAYSCHDAQAPIIVKYRHNAFMTVVDPALNCTTTIGDSGVVLDGSYQSNDCIIRFKGPVAPNMTYTGPGPFEQLNVANNEIVWAGMHYNVMRDMDTRAHQCHLSFTGHFLPVDGDTADNIPDHTTIYQSKQMFVYWGPQSLNIPNQKPYYLQGDTLTCECDAWPPATFLWQNMRNGQIFSGATYTVGPELVGFNQSMRCEARNSIEGTTYSNNIFIPLDVPVPTTPTTPTTTPTTTPPPAVSPCPDPSGAWVSVNPTAGSLCVRVNTTLFGAITGLLKNATDTYWVDLVGRTQINQYNQMGVSGIWPGTIGVSSLVGECHRCFGVENLLINVVTRRKGLLCGTEGDTQYTSQYHFFRSSTLKCPNVF